MQITNHLPYLWGIINETNSYSLKNLNTMTDLKNYGFPTQPFMFGGASNRDFTPRGEWVIVNKSECPPHIRAFDVSPTTKSGQCLFAIKRIGEITLYAANTYDGGCVCFISKHSEMDIGAFADAPSGYTMLTPCSGSVTADDLRNIYGKAVRFCEPTQRFTNAAYTTYFK